MEQTITKPIEEKQTTEWQTVRLGDVVDVNPTRRIEKNREIKFVAMDELRTFSREILSYEKRVAGGSGSKFTNGDTLLARITPCLENGKTAYVSFLDSNEVGNGSTEFIVLSGKNSVTDNLFVYYLSTSPDFRNYAIQHMEGTSGRQRVPNSAVANYHFKLPPINQQRSIASILGSLDDKIELNRQMNETLEQTAQVLFKSWFVDFDPVRAKAEGRDTGLPKEIADLFPDSFEDSMLGEIPKGWSYQKVDSLAEVGIGKTPPRKEFEWFSQNPTDVPWVSIRDMGNAGAYILKTDEYLTKEAVEKFSIRRIPKDTVLVSFKMTVGRVSITDQEMTTNEAIAHFKLAEASRISKEYLYSYLKCYDFYGMGSTSSIVEAVNSKMIKAIPILVPNEGVMSSFRNFSLSLFEQIRQNSREFQDLAQLREALLPKLLSGEMNVT